MGAWYIRIIGRQRQEVDINLLVQAVIALGEQMAEEERRTQQSPTVADSESSE